MPHSSISDIGQNVLMITPELAEALATEQLPDPVLAANRLQEYLIDYLSHGQIIGSEILPGARHPTDLLTDGTWTWYRTAVYYVRTFRCVDMRLFAHAMHKDFRLDPEYLNKDLWIPPTPGAHATEREEHATWRD